MDAALGWLGDIFRAVLLLCPRLIIVRSTHAGIKFRRGREEIVINPGLHVYWPLVTEVEIIPVRYRTRDLQQQYLETSDNKKVGVGGVVAYEIHDIRRALCDCWDHEDVIRDKGLAAVKAVVTTNKYNYFKGDVADTALTSRLAGELTQFGITVTSVQLSDFSESKMFAVWGMGGSEE